MNMDEYPLFEPPFMFETFAKLSRTDSKRFFDWYVNVASRERSEILYSLIGVAPEPTPESLVTVWSRVIPLITWREMLDEEMEGIKHRMGPRFQDLALDELGLDRKSLTARSLSLAVDTGFHLARVFIANVPGAQWMLETRRDSNQNEPVVGGFGAVRLNPPKFVVGSMGRVMRGKGAPEDLLTTYRYWMTNLVR